MSDEPRPSYDANVTAPVRYDKDLPPSVKLLYAEIRSLTRKEGYCYASNQYFADLYNAKPGTVSGWITQLVDKGYITREVIRDPKTKEVVSRKLWLSEAPPSPTNIGDPLPDKNRIPLRQKSKGIKESLNKKKNTLPSEEPAPAPQTEPETVEEIITDKHPAIMALREVMLRYPAKQLWKRLATVIGNEPDIERLQECYEQWCMKGWNKTNFGWVTDWYAKDGPQPHTSSAQVSKSPYAAMDESIAKSRIDYPWLIALQEQQLVPLGTFNDPETYKTVKGRYLEALQNTPWKLELGLKEIAEYESSTQFKERFNGNL